MKKQIIYTRQFFLVCFSSLFFSASYNMLITELPSYLSSLNGTEYKGLIISLFTLTAGLSRPFSGKLIDTIGRKPVLIIGAFFCVLSGLFYPILTSVSGFLFLRLVHGFSCGFSPTAMTAYVSDIIPKNRLGEAMGIQGLAFSIGLALGPALGSYVKLYSNYNVLFFSSSFFALLSILLILKLKEPLVDKKRFQFRSLKVSKSDVISKEAMPVALITFIAYSGFGVILTIIPDLSDHIGIINKGIFFIVFTLASIFVRLIAGKISDIYGRKIVISIGLIILVLALLLLGKIESTNDILIAAILYGLAMGIISPTVSAWTIDLSNPLTKGKSIATMYIALESGIGLGAILSGWYYQDVLERIPTIFNSCAFFAGLALVYMAFYKKRSVKL